MDTVKQAEVFAAVRERFGVGSVTSTRKLRDFPTLNHVVGWVKDKTGVVPAVAAELAGPERGAELARGPEPAAADCC